MDTPPFLIKESFSTYLEMGAHYLRSHPLALFRKSPYEYWAELNGITEVEDKKPQSFGRAAHSLILEGESALFQDYTLIPDDLAHLNKNTNMYQGWKISQTKHILSDKEYTGLRRMQFNIQQHETASGLLSKGVAERTVRAKYLGRPCQIRIDFFNGNIVDLKTCRDLNWFEYDARKFEYHHQMAFYKGVYSAAAEAEFPPDVYIIAVESDAPHRVGVWKMKDDLLEFGMVENMRAVKKLKECEEFNHFPTGFETVRPLGFYMRTEQ